MGRFERYECATCCYATDSYSKFMEHGMTHSTSESKQMTIQTCSEKNGIKRHNSVKDAFEHASNDPTVWKVSFTVGKERVRFVSNGDGTWTYETID